MSDRVICSIEDHIANVMLNRPEKYNALDMQAFAELSECGEALKADPRVRAVVLHGAGQHFCSGIDLQSLQSELAEPSAFAEKAFSLAEGESANFFQKPVRVWQELRVPVIAALRGVAFGGGCQIALGADIRLAAPDTRLSVMEIKWGIIPDMGISQTLQSLVRDDVARELLYTGREVEASEAALLGLLTHLRDDPLAAALEMARTIASKNPDAVRACKELLDQAPRLSAAQGLQLEAKLQATVLGRGNQREAVRAHQENRAPVFGDAEL